MEVLSSITTQQVYGALLGRQAGRKVEISNCFELKVVGEEEIETQDQDHFLEIPKIIDDQYFATKFDLCNAHYFRSITI